MAHNDFDIHYISQLVKETQRGNSDAFAELFAASYQDEYEEAYRRLRSETLSQDALFQTFNIVYRSILKVHTPEIFLSWLRQINVRVCQKLAKEQGDHSSADPQPMQVKSILPDAVADKILENIFKTYDLTPNAIPLDKLTSWGNFKRTDFCFCQILTAFMLVLFLLVPLCFIAPDIEISKGDEISNTSAVYTVKVHSLVPVRSVTASLNGTEIPVKYIKNSSYSLAVKDNGTLIVEAALLGGQRRSESASADAIDREAPKCLSYTLSSGKLYLEAQDKGAGIDYGKIYAVTPEGGELAPQSYDKKDGSIVFDFGSSSITVFIPDRIGNTLKLTIGG